MIFALGAFKLSGTLENMLDFRPKCLNFQLKGKILSLRLLH